MFKWNCPFCDAAHQLPEARIGRPMRCARCGQVTVPQIEKALSVQHAEPLTDQTSTPRPVSIPGHVLSHESVTFGAKILIALTVVVLLGCGLALISRAAWTLGTVLIGLGILAIMQAVLISPIYTMVEDTRANRRLLERLVLLGYQPKP